MIAAALALLAGAAPDGAALYLRHCTSCHAVEPGANSAAGPTLHGVMARPVAGASGYDYSPALRSFARAHPRWTPELLDRFLAGPDKLIPGTEMGLPGIADASERRTLIDWLGRNVPAPR